MIGDTASISLLTGLPGAGKSLRLAQAISVLVEKGEHVYYSNIDGLKIRGTTHWPDPKDWRDLPSGAILFVDEAQHYFPARRSGDPPNEVIMNKIRHDGIRLVLATQQPNYLDTYLRGLIGFHEHLLRCNGKEASFIFRNNTVMEEVRAPIKRIKTLYDYNTWNFPKQYFACYESAEVHTVKYQMPALVKRALMILPIAVILAVGAWYTVFRDSSLAHAGEPDKKTPPSAASLSGTPAAASSVASVSSAEGYVQMLAPMVSDVPWSAPAFVGRPVVSDPHVYCMSTENSCRCVTEQNTRVQTIRDDVCREIARNGEPYNPFKAPPQPAQAQQVVQGGQGSDDASGARHTQPAQRPASIISKQTRALGTFPESKPYPSSSVTPPTTLDM
ncbi:zonular occludens toxin domain-containing protein [Xanthomonas sp. LMG 12460]|uniref:zonular occludens toxin domain-containing protein n=1 Tax=Xanthomonas sp. LMG 12460 TaxID=1591132 RepID=UPI0012657565|nr:zonular occludens toxin domain-containing protein [Xanthomonas sp. LMG 12460]KAB7775656.1 zonular occludens toxin [Xanthomonas sp. LMG 12460]